MMNAGAQNKIDKISRVPFCNPQELGIANNTHHEKCNKQSTRVGSYC